MTLPRLTLVTGGARSGKSRLAERLARLGATPHHYIATAEAHDAEMAARIAHHRHDRGPDWRTHEAPLDLAGTLAGLDTGTVLVDCATLWLSNHLLAGHDTDTATTNLLTALAAAQIPVVVVSNEVGWSIVPDNRLARQFQDAQGRLNQRLAEQADLVVTVISGLPLVLKGNLPAGLA